MRGALGDRATETSNSTRCWERNETGKLGADLLHCRLEVTPAVNCKRRPRRPLPVTGAQWTITAPQWKWNYPNRRPQFARVSTGLIGKRRRGGGAGGLFPFFLFPWGSQSLLHAETRGVFLIMSHTQLDQSEDSILIHAPIWIIRKYDRRLQWRGQTFFFFGSLKGKVFAPLRRV